MQANYEATKEYRWKLLVVSDGRNTSEPSDLETYGIDNSVHSWILQKTVNKPIVY